MGEIYDGAVALLPLPVMGFWAKVILAVALCAVAVWWLRRMTGPRG